LNLDKLEKRVKEGLAEEVNALDDNEEIKDFYFSACYQSTGS
jgi:hypothetical protein